MPVAVEVKRAAGHIFPLRMAEIDVNIIPDIAAKREVDGESRVLHADVDIRSFEDQPHDPEFCAARWYP